MHLPFFFFDGAFLIEFKAPNYYFWFLFPLIMKKRGKFSMNPVFALGWHFKRKKPKCQKKAPINTNQQQMYITNKQMF
jgi:hypothetical protein